MLQEMTNSTASANPVQAAGGNLALSIRGLVQIAVGLTRVLDNGARQAPPPGADAPFNHPRDGDEIANLRAAVAALDVAGTDEGRRTEPIRIPTNTRPRTTTQVPRPMPKVQTQKGPVPVKERGKFYCVFVGTEVGVVTSWCVLRPSFVRFRVETHNGDRSTVKNWTDGVPYSSHIGFKTRAAAVQAFRDAIERGEVKLVDNSGQVLTTHRRGLITITRDDWFNGAYERLTRFAEPDALKTLPKTGSSLSASTTMTPSNTISSISTGPIDDEFEYGFEESAEFNALCHQAVDEVEARDVSQIASSSKLRA
ncbi:hypothetical protein SCHPADRAFT_896650 [Schizopora paradoxa]|uniref:Uncharacterized protein n=1 Tax=Schizopora paradoxa TaxID=27342 RepID=A0A0H2QZN5_9AGAM|nr:hypothetical protein SCHPADRAFT_896650 [Schizopora paradoxa]